MRDIAARYNEQRRDFNKSLNPTTAYLPKSNTHMTTIMNEPTRIDRTPSGDLVHLADLMGMVLSRAERLYYHHRDKVDRTTGDLQLWFGERVVGFSPASDGEGLEIATEAWVDPFAGEQGPENVEYLARHGRHVLHDVSAEPEYADLIGSALLAIEPRVDPPGKLTGGSLRFQASALHVHVEFDELFVSRGPTMPPQGAEE